MSTHRFSGSALAVLSGAGRKYQIGIVSAAADCSVPEAAYGVYTRISSYADWIQQIVQTHLASRRQSGKVVV